MYLASDLKIFYFLPKVNMVTIFFILNLCPSDRETVAFSSLQLYIAKLIGGLTVINIWLLLHLVLMEHKFQSPT